MINIDKNEGEKFSRLADRAWNHNCELKTLHQFNPRRV
ncbi:bifunctional 3-demethylubiquinol 3-O-methyltransferase/2-polyprenyl-6-hydroxyphenol methylase, partial [Francisella tularensis subsp. holarctica]|nr:bifunctional 3-demethylubiquinol 3-O-methyltransferase/2-polyprenyl-6-hydroxyphenol methylase [Francisella tularensis subsp. holarctica]